MIKLPYDEFVTICDHHNICLKIWSLMHFACLFKWSLFNIFVYGSKFIWEIWREILTVLSREGKILIQNLWESKTYSSRRLIKEFSNKNWKRRTLDDFIRKLRSTGLIECTAGSGWPKSSWTEEHISAVDELIQSQEDKPKTHLSTWQISRELNLPRTIGSSELSITTWISNAENGARRRNWPLQSSSAIGTSKTIAEAFICVGCQFYFLHWRKIVYSGCSIKRPERSYLRASFNAKETDFVRPSVAYQVNFQ